MKILCFAGSLRKGSLNKKYVRVAHGILSGALGVEATLIELNDYELPVYNQDIEDREFPQAAKDLAALVKAADALVISSPENNGSISALLKNTVDWVSRPQVNPWKGKHILLMGASPGYFGALRGLWHSRRPFEALFCQVWPEMSPLPRAHEAFDEKGALKDKASHERLAQLLNSYVEFVRPRTN
jgi:chromate reductase